jgi:hypothetical protein
MRATMPWVDDDREQEAWPLVVDAPSEDVEEQAVTVFRSMAIWIGFELAVVGAVFTVV